MSYSSRSISVVLLALGLGVTLLVGCGPTEEEENSASLLDANVRQINALCEDISMRASNEGQMTRSELSEYIDEYKDEIRDVRLELVAADIVDDYNDSKSILENLMNDYVELLDLRERYYTEVLDAGSAYSSYLEGLRDAGEEYDTSMLLLALEDAEDFIKSREEVEELDEEYYSLAEAHVRRTDDYNDSMQGKILSDSAKTCDTLYEPSEVIKDQRNRIDTLEVEEEHITETFDLD